MKKFMFIYFNNVSGINQTAVIGADNYRSALFEFAKTLDANGVFFDRSRTQIYECTLIETT